MTGLMVLAIHQYHPDCPPAILMTAFSDATARYDARRVGAAAYFEKPFPLKDLVQQARELAPP